MATDGMLTTSNLHARIEGAIATCSRCTEKPSFNMEQLVLMACAFLEKNFDQEDVFTWIINHFPYYSNMASKALLEQLRNRSKEDTPKVRHLLEEINDAMIQVELPLHKSGERVIKWEVDMVKLLPLLREVARRGCTTEEAAFDFFGLPAEIRVMIYELSFGYDGGLLIQTCGSTCQTWVVPTAKDPSTIPSFRHLNSKKRGRITRPWNQILGPLRTCRQFYNEAMPTFYRINSFYFHGFGDLYSCLSHMPPARREHISSISAEYQYWDSSHGPKSFSLLAELNNLQKLTLSIDEHKWLAQKLSRGAVSAQVTETDKDKLIWKLPGLAGLRSLPNLAHVKFYGPCKRVKSLVKMELLRREADAGADGGGAKSESDKVAPESSKGKKSKKAKAA